MEKWEAKAKARDAKARKRQAQDMVVRGRSIRTIVETIVKRSKKEKR